MKTIVGIWRRLAAIAISIGLAALTQPAALAADRFPGITSPDAVVFGMTYGQWSAAWWQHVFQLPKKLNPIHDPTGENCHQQQSGPVWFLAGHGAGRAVRRTCTIPAGKAVFFPILNVQCSTLESPPFYASNEAGLRACVGPIADGIDPDSLKVAIDGVDVPSLQRYRVLSPKFDVALPGDNILGVLQKKGSLMSDGYWLMLEPLKPGWHVVHFEGRFASGVGKGHSQNVTYNLIVTE